jgi:hypothetical protein
LDDVIKQIEKLRLDKNSTPYQSFEQPRPSHKGPPKWLTKTLESVHPNEVRIKEPYFPQNKMEVM